MDVIKVISLKLSSYRSMVPHPLIGLWRVSSNDPSDGFSISPTSIRILKHTLELDLFPTPLGIRVRVARASYLHGPYMWHDGPHSPRLFFCTQNSQKTFNHIMCFPLLCHGKQMRNKYVPFLK